MSKIAFISHCLLNNLSKVENFDNKNKDLIKYLLENDVDLIQMPCPEFTLYGGRRFGQVKEQYDTPFFRKHCSLLIEPLIQQIEEYKRNEHQILGIFAIKGSPSCGYLHTVSGSNWTGEIKENSDILLKNVKLINGSGVFMEELLKKLPDDTSIIEVDESDIEKTLQICKEII